MVAHADWYAPAPVQILSASTDAAKKAELVSQRAALINEGKANPIASTRKEYLDMKARHCRPCAITEHLALSRTQPQRSALSSQLSALSLSLTDTRVPTPDVRRRPTAPPSPPDRRQYEAGRSRAARSPGPAPRALGAALRALATLPRGLGSPPSHMSLTRREDARPGIRRDPYPVLLPSCRPAALLPPCCCPAAALLLPQRVGTAAVPYEHPRSTLPRPSLAAGPARE